MPFLRFSFLNSMVALALTSCTSYRIDEALIDNSQTKDQFYHNNAEVLFLAQKVNDQRLLDMVRLVPIATEHDCLCGAGDPGDAPALILTRAFAIDPECKFLARYSPKEKWLIFQYASALHIVDVTDDYLQTIKVRYHIQDMSSDGAAASGSYGP